MTLDFDTLRVVALLNSSILMIVFAGVLWAYRSFSATRYWLCAMALHGTGTGLMALEAAGGSAAAAAFGSWLFAIAYAVTWQGARVFHAKPPLWRPAVVIVVLSAGILLALATQPRPAQNLALALLQIALLTPIAFTTLRHPLRSGGFVVLGGAALALTGNFAEAATNLALLFGFGGPEQFAALATWLYLAVIVGGGICYVGLLLMAFDRVRTQQQNFVALVTHEFRAPLGVIAAAAHNLSLSPDASADEIRLRTGRIQQTVRRMSMLIDNIFAGDRFDTWQAPVAARASFDLNDLLRHIEAGYDSDTAGRLGFSYGDAAPVKGDRGLLEIAIQNVIQNALKYSAAASPVMVQLTTEPGSAGVVVADQGPGIPADDHERIFLKYYRVAGQPPNGSGLGLYVSRAVARQHGGDLTLAASGPGGSTFRLSLPSA